MKKYSKKKYIFACSTQVILGSATNLILKGLSDREICPKRVLTNIVQPSMMFLTDIICSGEHVHLTDGLLDATVYWNMGKGRKVSWPILSMTSVSSIHGQYTGYVPPGYFVGQPYIISYSIIGPEVLR